MKQVLSKLFTKENPVKIFATVVKPLAGGRYRVSDSQNRVQDVDADQQWKYGDGVTVSQGRIVGRAAKYKTPKIYEV